MTKRVMAGGPQHLEVIDLTEGGYAWVMIERVPDNCGRPCGHYEWQQTVCPLRRYTLKGWSVAHVLTYPGATQGEIADACERAYDLRIA